MYYYGLIRVKDLICLKLHNVNNSFSKTSEKKASLYEIKAINCWDFCLLWHPAQDFLIVLSEVLIVKPLALKTHNFVPELGGVESQRALISIVSALQ